MAFQICPRNKTDLFLVVAPICEESRTKVQLAVPLREITLKKPIFASRARSWIRVHVWQLHVDILPAAYSELHSTGGRKGKSGGGHLTIGALQVRRWTSTAVKTGVCNVNLSMACNVLSPLSSFAFYDLDCFPLVLDCSWSLVSTYIRYSMTCKAHFAFKIVFLKEIIVKIPVGTLQCWFWTLFLHFWSCCHLVADEVPSFQLHSNW